MERRRTTPTEPHVRVARGVHRNAAAPDVFAASVQAWRRVLPADARLTHVTGALALGMWAPWLPGAVREAGRIWIQLPMTSSPVRRPEVTAVRALESGPAAEVGLALPVAAVGDVLLALATDLDPTDLLVAVDSALQLRLIDSTGLWDVARPRRRGAPALRRVLALADGRSESAWETLLREFHRVMEVEVEPQYEVRDAAGAFVARGDLRLVGYDVLHEYDGSHHLEVERQRSDLRRARRLEAAGWVRRGYTSDDLLHRPDEMAAELDRTLGRPSDPRRLAAWRQLVAGSAVTRRGRTDLWGRLGL